MTDKTTRNALLPTMLLDRRPGAAGVRFRSSIKKGESTRRIDRTADARVQ